MKYFLLLLCNTQQVKNHKGQYYTRLKGRGSYRPPSTNKWTKLSPVSTKRSWWLFFSVLSFLKEMFRRFIDDFFLIIWNNKWEKLLRRPHTYKIYIYYSGHIIVVVFTFDCRRLPMHFTSWKFKCHIRWARARKKNVQAVSLIATRPFISVGAIAFLLDRSTLTVKKIAGPPSSTRT